MAATWTPLPALGPAHAHPIVAEGSAFAHVSSPAGAEQSLRHISTLASLVVGRGVARRGDCSSEGRRLRIVGHALHPLSWGPLRQRPAMMDLHVGWVSTNAFKVMAEGVRKRTRCRRAALLMPLLRIGVDALRRRCGMDGVDEAIAAQATRPETCEHHYRVVDVAPSCPSMASRASAGSGRQGVWAANPGVVTGRSSLLTSGSIVAVSRKTPSQLLLPPSPGGAAWTSILSAS